MQTACLDGVRPPRADYVVLKTCAAQNCKRDPLRAVFETLPNSQSKDN